MGTKCSLVRVWYLSLKNLDEVNIMGDTFGKKQRKEISQFMSEFITLLNYKTEKMADEWKVLLKEVENIIAGTNDILIKYNEVEENEMAEEYHEEDENK